MPGSKTSGGYLEGRGVSICFLGPCRSAEKPDPASSESQRRDRELRKVTHDNTAFNLKIFPITDIR